MPVRVSPSGDRLASNQWDDTIFVWDGSPESTPSSPWSERTFRSYHLYESSRLARTDYVASINHLAALAERDPDDLTARLRSSGGIDRARLSQHDDRINPAMVFQAGAYHVVGRSVPARLEVEARLGGRITEVAEDGARVLWGTIEALEAPRYLAMRFHIPHPEEVVQARTLVELTFTPTRGGTRVALKQSDWEALGKLAKPLRGGYGGGWAVIFDVAYGAACNSGTQTGE